MSPPAKKVAVLGAGMVTKPMIDYFLDHCRYGVIVATRTKDKATQIIHGRGHGHDRRRRLWWIQRGWRKTRRP